MIPSSVSNLNEGGAVPLDMADETKTQAALVPDIPGDKVRLGFDFPGSVRIHRREVHAAMVAEQKAWAA